MGKPSRIGRVMFWECYLTTSTDVFSGARAALWTSLLGRGRSLEDTGRGWVSVDTAGPWL